MHDGKLNGALALGLLLAIALACNFNVSTARLDNARLSTQQSGDPQANNFKARDTVYVVFDVRGTSGKMKVNGQLIAENVEGLSQNEKLAEVPLEVPGDTTGNNFRFTPPQTSSANGWPAGTYKVQIKLADEDGDARDEENLSFMVGGS
ncbi:MAG: hypothetical protein H0V88_00065 [Pyrinomonadaceae bacterium]|nr:hypothetical protein [Pyrinomonadaceae bacterium]